MAHKTRKPHTLCLSQFSLMFSTFGNILTKLQNWIGTETVTTLAKLKMHLRDKQVRSGSGHDCMQRQFVGSSGSSSSLNAPGNRNGDISSPLSSSKSTNLQSVVVNLHALASNTNVDNSDEITMPYMGEPWLQGRAKSIIYNDWSPGPF